jgi:hypothetical protein
MKKKLTLAQAAVYLSNFDRQITADGIYSEVTWAGARLTRSFGRVIARGEFRSPKDAEVRILGSDEINYVRFVDKEAWVLRGVGRLVEEISRRPHMSLDDAVGVLREARITMTQSGDTTRFSWERGGVEIARGEFVGAVASVCFAETETSSWQIFHDRDAWLLREQGRSGDNMWEVPGDGTVDIPEEQIQSDASVDEFYATFPKSIDLIAEKEKRLQEIERVTGVRLLKRVLEGLKATDKLTFKIQESQLRGFTKTVEYFLRDRGFLVYKNFDDGSILIACEEQVLLEQKS